MRIIEFNWVSKINKMEIAFCPKVFDKKKYIQKIEANDFYKNYR